MQNGTARLTAVYDTLTELLEEVSHLLVELHAPGGSPAPASRSSRSQESPEPVTTMGGLRVMPDALLADLGPADSDLLILPGAGM